MINVIKKKFLFYPIMFVLTYFLIESFSYIIYFIIEGRPFLFSRTDIKTNYSEYNNTDTYSPILDANERIEILHPYLGFVYNPESNTKNFTTHHRHSISEYGFIDKASPIHLKSKNKIIIGIFGGSIAYWFSVSGAEDLINELKKSPVFSDKEIIIVRVALGGYKQPQQFLALSYLLSLGAQFDIVINLDGFNDVALPASENVPKDIFPFYPRSWYMFTQDLTDTEVMSLIGEITYLKKKRKRLLEFFSRSPLRYSITLNLLGRRLEHDMAVSVCMLQLKLFKHKLIKNKYITTGPSFNYDSEFDLYRSLTSVWMNSSIQMHKLCQANNVKYFHFLQPNQYVKGTKPMGNEELKQSFLDGHPYKAPVEKGYPYLIEAGKELTKEGVNFYDLTKIFINEHRPIYIDTCCHFNTEGNKILGKFIGETIVHNLRDENIE